MEYQYYLKTGAVARAGKGGQGKGANPLVFKFIFLAILFSAPSISNAQSVPEIGVSAGITQYMGDLNTSKIFFMPSFSGGGIFILNLNQRTGIKTNVSYFRLKGEGMNYKNIPESFKNTYLHYNLTYFVNFLDYDFSLKKNNFTPYFAIGIGYSKIFSTSSDAKNNLSIPFGPGIKYLVKNRMSIGLEYTFYRSFNDQVDGKSIVNYGDLGNKIYPSNIANRDWYSYLSLVITFKFINFADDCPAYN